MKEKNYKTVGTVLVVVILGALLYYFAVTIVVLAFFGIFKLLASMQIIRNSKAVAVLDGFTKALISGGKIWKSFFWFLGGKLKRLGLYTLNQLKVFVTTAPPRTVVITSVAFFVVLSFSAYTGFFLLSYLIYGEDQTVKGSNPPAPSQLIPYPKLVPVPIGAFRYQMDEAQRRWRSDAMIESRTFWILRESGAEEGAERITSEEYQSYIGEASKTYNVPHELIEGIHYLESFGKADAKSPTGPIGSGQFTARTASNIGKIDGGKCFLKFKGYDCGQALPKKLPPIEVDNRKNIRLSVLATAKLLGMEYDFFADWGFSIMAYHSSRGDVIRWIKMFISPQPVTLGGKADLQKYNVSFEKLYFGSTPYHNPGTYRIYRELMDKDWGPNYPWKVWRSISLLKLYKIDKVGFQQLAEAHRYQGKRAKFRMWTFYGADDMALISLEQLKAQISLGELVTLPNQPENFGFKLRIGRTGIGAQDPGNAQHYTATKMETAGALLFLGEGMTWLRKQGNKNPTILDVTSVTRTVEYQKDLVKKNSAATKQLSFHVMGLAFDISKTVLAPDEDRDLKFLLDELDSIGFISWVPENHAYHVVVSPNKDAREFFTNIYRDKKDFQIVSPLAQHSGWF